MAILSPYAIDRNPVVVLKSNMTWKQPPLHSVWKGMISRCYDQKRKAFKDYGARGIKVCPQWHYDFKQFIADMGPRTEGMTLDRIDNNKDYTPENCKWSTRKDQARNTRRNVILTIEGEEHKLYDLVDKSGIKPDVIKRRVELGLTLDQILIKGRVHNKHNRPFPAISEEKRKAGAQAAAITKLAKTHCSKGHLWSEHAYTTPQGIRSCNECRRIRLQNKCKIKLETLL